MLSIIIPVYNEAESLDALFAEIDEVARTNNYQLDIVFVDDGSTDGSWQRIVALTHRDARVRGLKFRRNFGKAAALNAGFQTARGELVMTLDADLQDDPHEIPRFLAKIAAGCDVVSGWKQVRHDPWHKVGPSRVFNWMVSRLTGVKLHDHNCGMKCYRSEIFDEVRLYGEMHRFVPVLAAGRGYSVGELAIHHRARKFGNSKYGVRRFLKGFLDLLTVHFLTGFRQRPQHMLGGSGLLCIGLGGLGLLLCAISAAATAILGASQLPLQTAGLILSVGSILLGGQLLSIGFVAELVTAMQSRSEDTYSVSECAPACQATAATSFSKRSAA